MMRNLSCSLPKTPPEKSGWKLTEKKRVVIKLQLEDYIDHGLCACHSRVFPDSISPNCISSIHIDETSFSLVPTRLHKNGSSRREISRSLSHTHTVRSFNPLFLCICVCVCLSMLSSGPPDARRLCKTLVQCLLLSPPYEQLTKVQIE